MAIESRVHICICIYVRICVLTINKDNNIIYYWQYQSQSVTETTRRSKYKNLQILKIFEKTNTVD